MDIFDQASYAEEGRAEKQAEIDTLRAELADAREEIARLNNAMWLMACDSKELQADLRDQGGYFIGAEMLRADAVAMRAALDGGSPSAC